MNEPKPLTDAEIEGWKTLAETWVRYESEGDMEAKVYMAEPSRRILRLIDELRQTREALRIADGLLFSLCKGYGYTRNPAGSTHAFRFDVSNGFLNILDEYIAARTGKENDDE